jgi:repressor of nif and glnA expression
MPRNELLVFRILRILRTKQVQYLDERQIMTAIQRETGDEFNASTIQAHLHYMQQHGLLKPINLKRQGNGYALDWAGYDYLDAS